MATGNQLGHHIQPHKLEKMYRTVIRRPDIKACLTSGAIMAVSDFICQRIVKRYEENAFPVTEESLGVVKVEKFTSHEWDSSRTIHFSLVGLTLHGPLFFNGFKWLDNTFGASKTVKVALAKTVLGQMTIFPIYVALSSLYIGALQGKSLDQTKIKLSENFSPNFVHGWAFWPSANVINFLFVPPSYRVAYINGAGIVWNTYLSWKNSKFLA